MSNQGVSQLRVSFSLGEARPKVQHWIDASSKDDPHGRMLGRKELRTTGGQGSAFDGSVFTLPNGDTFDPPA